MSFTLAFTDKEKAFLRALAANTIAKALGQEEMELPFASEVAASEKLQSHLGAFVTLKREGQLRGCIGNIVGTKPLVKVIEEMAGAAAFRDPRFKPLQASELKDLELEISVMGPIEPCPDPQQIEIGRHGLIMKRGHKQGLLLPQVPVEWGWDRETFLAKTCEKAGLPRDAWKDKETQIFWFEAVIF